MRTKVNLLAFASALCALLFAPAAWAEDADAQLVRELEQRLLAAEDKLQDSEATIQAQRDLLKTQAAPAVGQGTSLDKFFSKLEVGGYIAGSYTYSFSNPSTNQGPGAAPVISQPLCQFNCNHNTFQFDAAKIDLGKSTDGPGTAGFELDLLFGANNQILGGQGTANDTGVYVQQAYAAYNLDGVELKFGKFETILGYEVLDSIYNPNISHGILFTFAIPIVHNGLLASGDFNENLGWTLGFVNGYNNIVDTNDNKGALGQIRFSDGGFATSLSGYYGADNGSPPGVVALPAGVNTLVSHGNGDDALILDLVTTLDISDEASLWLNADYGKQENLLSSVGSFTDTDWYGVSAGGLFQLNEKLSFAVRGEWMYDENGARLTGPLSGPGAGFVAAVPAQNARAYSLTGTLSYNLTENLKTRAEFRYDRISVSRSLDDVFPEGSCNGGARCPGAGSKFDDDGMTGYIEVSYQFD